jgi:esterase FrsA
LHLPEGVSNAPVLLWTGGVDKVLTEHYGTIQRYVKNGYAVITFDIPGGGLNTETIIEPGKEHSSHQAALAYVQSDARLRNDHISVLTSSGGGISLIEFAIRNDNKLSAVVARCAVVDGILTKPFLFQKLPLMTAQSFGKRVGADINDLDSYGKYTIPLSLKTKGYFDGHQRMKTPLLAINTKDDRVASPEDMAKTAAISENGQVQFFGEKGHCPHGEAAEQAIFDFITANSR